MSLLQRVKELEARLKPPAPEITAAFFRDACRHFGFDVPEPEEGEAVGCYVDRLPIETVLGFVKRGVHGQS